MTSKTTAKDFFLYLGVFIGLYVSAINFLVLVFAIINKLFPIAGQYYYDSSSVMRWPIAILIIFFPAFIYLAYFVNKELKMSPDKKELGIRRGAIIFTLFASGLTILIDLATLIYRFLGAEDLSIRFFLKVFIILALAIAIFRYYFWEFKRDASLYTQGAKTFVYIASGIVLAAIVLGVYLIGSPFAQHAKNLDQTRINDLMNIQSYVVYTAYQQKNSVPEALTNDPITGFTVPKDPETSLNYEYKKFSADSFELCATFSASSTDDKNVRMLAPAYPYTGVNENWMHPAGHYCFSRVIDATIFKGNGVPVKY